MRRIVATLWAGSLVSSFRSRALLGACLGAALVACGGGGDGGSGPPVSPVASVTLSQQVLDLRVGASATLTATPRDQAGTALTGRSVVWASSNPSVAAVTPTGIVTGLAAGAASVSATVDGRSASVQVTVAPAVGRVAVTAPSATVDQGQSMTLTAQVFDTGNGVIPGAAVTWASSNEAVATVSPAGVVTARTPGTVVITATSENISGTVSLLVRPIAGGTLAVSAIAPATLAAGSTATITGTGFSAVPGENTVTIGGVVVPVTTASATQLTVSLAGDLPCTTLRDVDVTVSSPFGTATRAHPLQTATRRTLAVGEALFLAEESGLRCNELAGGSRFLVAVTNTAPASTSIVNFDLRGSAPAGVAAATAPVAPVVRAAVAAPASRPRADVAARTSRNAAHARLLAGDRELVRRLGKPPRRATRGSSSLLAAAAEPVPTTVGAKDTLRVRSMDNCRTFTSVPARVVYVGTRSIILEADDSPLAGQMDGDYQELGREFDETMFDILTANFGSPLAYDAQTDQNGRIVMLFTKVINQTGAGLLAFVSACDFYPPTLDPQVAASNQAEVFYARVPSTNTSTYRDNDERVVWKWRMRATLIHEAKHIVSYASKFQTDADAFEESWLEEGSAQIAEELYGRTFWKTGWKSNATYDKTMYCDIRPNPASFPECPSPRPPRAIGDHMVFLHDYAEDHEGQTFLSPGSETSHIYGSAWAFLRFLLDNYATSESAFLKELVAERFLSGVANVERRTGRGFAELATNFALALASDDIGGFVAPAGARYGFPSWNLADMWAGAHRDLPSVFTSDRPFVVKPATLGTAFTASATLRGGSALVYELSGAAASRQLLEIARATAGSPLRIAILRTQ
ncbi:MAG TPA: Ig-like domain-containing protein [Gemmatimonadaceae bacterium]|nr:Ig-like domain-containing protein [Gemmatimonadaceae bacterium]